ncbi:MAG: hypothetical protein HQK83_03790 [Fibrobacteria bacterium]|nr:hypothetical protein [Fibrobacteria bacterium]
MHSVGQTTTLKRDDESRSPFINVFFKGKIVRMAMGMPLRRKLKNVLAFLDEQERIWLHKLDFTDRCGENSKDKIQVLPVPTSAKRKATAKIRSLEALHRECVTNAEEERAIWK